VFFSATQNSQYQLECTMLCA